MEIRVDSCILGVIDKSDYLKKFSYMNIQQEQLIKLLIGNSEKAGEIEAIHSRCCTFYGVEMALEKCQEIITFANETNLSLLECFRLHVEVELLKIHQ